MGHATVRSYFENHLISAVLKNNLILIKNVIFYITCNISYDKKEKKKGNHNSIDIDFENGFELSE